MFKFICKRTIREHQDTKMEMIGGLVYLNSDIRLELSNTRILAAISWAAFVIQELERHDQDNLWNDYYEKIIKTIYFLIKSMKRLIYSAYSKIITIIE